MRKKIPWEEIRNKYVYGIEKNGKLEFPTVRDLSKEYGVAINVIGGHSSKEGWVKLRENYLNESRTKTEQKIVEQISDEVVPFSTDLFEKAKKISTKVDLLIENIRRPNDALIIANTLRQLKELKDSVLGEKDNNETVAINIVVDSEESKDITERVIKGEGT